MTFIQQIFLALAVSLLIVWFGGWAFYGLHDYILPQKWMTNALRAGGGAAWINLRGGYQASGPLGKRVLAFVIGLIGVLVLYLGFKMIFLSGDSIPAYFLRYLRYALVGFWISGGAPWLFFISKLVSPTPQEPI